MTGVITMGKCERCGKDAVVDGKCIACGMPATGDQLIEFCRSIKCGFRSMLDDPGYQIDGSRVRAVAIMASQCRGCRAWQYDRYRR